MSLWFKPAGVVQGLLSVLGNPRTPSSCHPGSASSFVENTARGVNTDPPDDWKSVTRQLRMYAVESNPRQLRHCFLGPTLTFENLPEKLPPRQSLDSGFFDSSPSNTPHTSPAKCTTTSPHLEFVAKLLYLHPGSTRRLSGREDGKGEGQMHQRSRNGVGGRDI